MTLLAKDYIAEHGVTRIPVGKTHYVLGTTFKSKKSRLLWERHERTRQMYRDLVTHGFDKQEIARMMQVSEAQVRKITNAIGLIQELKGYGRWPAA